MTSLANGSDGAHPGASRDDRNGSDYLLAGMLKDAIISARWSTESISTKARSTLAAGVVVLGLVITGILGFAGLLGGGDAAAFWNPGDSQPGIRGAVLLLGTACLASISISISYCVRALKTIRVEIPAKYGAFTISGRLTDKISNFMMDAWESLPKKEMLRRIHVAYLKELRSLEKNIDTVSRHTMRGQAFLPGGLLSGVAASMLTLLAGS